MIPSWLRPILPAWWKRSSLRRISGRPLRIAYGRIFQETNAFSPLPTTRADFEALHCLDAATLAKETRLSGHELRGYLRHAELTGFVQAARVAGDVETVPLWSTLAVSGGPVTAEAFAWLRDETVRRLREVGPVDGVYLAMHGSMQVEGLDGSPEGAIIAALREATDGRLAVSYDLHGNLVASMLEPDVVVAFHTNPHRDMFGTGFRAGKLLIETLRGHTRPVHAWRKLPMVIGGGLTIDFLAPMRGVFERIAEMEREPGVLSANVFMVHPYNKADTVGWSVHVSSDGDAALANRCAEELADLVWAQREVMPPEMYPAGEVLNRVRDSSLWRKLGAVSLVDVDDIVGAGAPGGNTRLLSELIDDDRGLCTYVPLHDPAAVAACWSAPEGSSLAIALRGTPGYDQPEVSFDATIVRKMETDFGRTIRLDANHGALHVALTERPPYTCSPKFWAGLGLPARRADAIVQKAFFHYRMFYALTSFRHLGFVTDGASSLTRVRDRKYAVPMWPGQPVDDWRRHDPILRGIQPTREAAFAAPA